MNAPASGAPDRRIAAPATLLGWLVGWVVYAFANPRDPGGLGMVFALSHPFVMAWAVIGAIVAGTRYFRASPATRGNVRRNALWWGGAAAVYLLCFGVFLAQEVYGLKRGIPL